MSARTDPYLGYRFLVEIDSLIVAGFSEVTGLEMQLQTEDYQEGGVNTYTHKLPTRFEYPNLSLRRGITDSTVLWDWVQDVSSGLGLAPAIERRNVRIVLLDAQGAESWGWECRDAYPVRWAGPELRADQGAVAVESLELVHRGLSRLEGVP
jgi:phage tail-like protein